MPTKRNRMRRRGATFFELIIASLVTVVGVVGLFSLWTYSYAVIQSQRVIGVAGQIARADIEKAKVQGFWNLPKGVIGQSKTTAVHTGPTEYYDANGQKLNVTAPNAESYYSLVRQVVDSNFLPLETGGTYTLTGVSLRTVRTTVRRVSDNVVMSTMGTNLAKGGL